MKKNNENKNFNENENFTSDVFFATFHNPQNHGYVGTPDDVLDKLKEEYLAAFPDGRGAWTYCESADNSIHVHMVLIPKLEGKMRRDYFKRQYTQSAHFEVLKGTKRSALEYIHKNGKYELQGENVMSARFHGEVAPLRITKNQWVLIAELIELGLNPHQIVDRYPKLGLYATDITKKYLAHLLSKAPAQNPKKVFYMFGPSGTGKSYEYVNLCKTHGKSQVYRVTAYNNGAFSDYCGEKILILDDFKGQLDFDLLLNVLSELVSYIPARYVNAPNLWEEVYIISQLSPEELYEQMVPEELREAQPMEKLLSHIHFVVLYYKTWGTEPNLVVQTMAEYRRHIVVKHGSCSSSAAPK